MAANLINQLFTANTFQQWLGATTSLIGTANLFTNGNGESFFANTRLVIGGTSANVSLNVETGATINVATITTANTINLEGREVVVTGNISSKTVLTFSTGGGAFERNEIVFQGPDNTLANANATAVVYDWDGSSNLSIIRITGTFLPNANVYGVTSGADRTTNGSSIVTSNLSLPTNVTVERDLYVDGTTRVTGNVSIGGNLTVSGNITLDEIGFDDLQVSGSANIGNNLIVAGVSSLANANVAILSGSANTLIFTAINEAKAEAVAFSIALG
jgi:cytoskeletal protein CcmA (bactofilin family)